MTNHWGFLPGFVCGKLEGRGTCALLCRAVSPSSLVLSVVFLLLIQATDPVWILRGPCPSRRAERHFRYPPCAACLLYSLPQAEPSMAVIHPAPESSSTGDSRVTLSKSLPTLVSAVPFCHGGSLAAKRTSLHTVMPAAAVSYCCVTNCPRA